ncbi:MAG: hypothetical protein H8E84_04430 [Flavobacteriales bacterium]|nr:hypothetical protein [Flavobacteriales bacterium]
MKNKGLGVFILILFFILLAIFTVHISILHFLNHDLFANRIVASYVGNFVLTVMIFIFIYKNKEKKTEILGFLFLGGSLIKFTLFFVFLYPFYLQDNFVSTVEFLSFFIPYSIALIVETQQLIKALNSV